MTTNTSPGSNDDDNEFRQSVAIDSNEALELSVVNASGEVRIEASDRTDIHIIARRSDGTARVGSGHIPITVSTNGNAVSIHPEWALAGGLGSFTKKIRTQIQTGFSTGDWDFSGLRLSPDLDYDMRILVPNVLSNGSKVSVKTASGRVEIRELNADVSVITASAPATIDHIVGTVSVHSVSGSVAVRETMGSLEANTASGAITVTGGDIWSALRTVSGIIRVDGATLRNARVMTVSGIIDIRAIANNSQDYALETVSGSIALVTTVPAAARSYLTFKTLSGSGAAGGDWIVSRRRSWTAGAGDVDGPNFTIKTVSGTLTAQARCDAATHLRHDPLPSPLPPEIEAGPGSGLNGEPNDLEKGVEAATAWMKEFARGLQSTDERQPNADESQSQPIPETEPSHPTPQPSPWVWSTGSGAPPPANQTTPPVSPLTPSREPAPSSPDNSKRDRLQILEALQRGDIGVDEALSRLDSTDPTRPLA